MQSTLLVIVDIVVVYRAAEENKQDYLGCHWGSIPGSYADIFCDLSQDSDGIMLFILYGEKKTRKV